VLPSRIYWAKVGCIGSEYFFRLDAVNLSRKIIFAGVRFAVIICG